MLLARALQASAPAVGGHSPNLCSGRHRTTELDVQVTCTLSDQFGPDPRPPAQRRTVDTADRRTRRAPHTDYHRPVSTSNDTPTAILGIIFTH